MSKIENPIDVVNEQAEDAGLWFVPKFATEDYLQNALRRLHAAVEGESFEEIKWGTARGYTRKAE